MEEISEIMNIIAKSWVFKSIIGVVITTLVGWLLVDFKNTRKKIKDAPTKDDLAKLKDQAYRYTDDRVTLHEKDHKPILQAIAETAEDNKRIESKLDKLILIMVEKK
jgi:uncharacterized membrane-anchored protein YhcB (DUF1043 family)